MGLKCFLTGHKWQKLGGPFSRGNGKFEQKLICGVCRKVKYHIS